MAERLFATMSTNAGDIRLELFPNHAPKTVRNFVELGEGSKEWKHPGTGATSTDKYYDGTVFHRVIDGFMIQGGDPLGQGTGGPGYEFDDEIHPDLKFTKPYLLAMANAGQRGGHGTNGSQFFITTGQTPHLNGKHTIFGEVVDQESRDVVDKIGTTQTGRGDRPVQEQRIETLTFERVDG